MITVQSPPEKPQEAPLPDLGPLTPAERLARAVLLFHRGGIWTPEDHATWRALTGTVLCTQKNLCELARQVQRGETP